MVQYFPSDTYHTKADTPRLFIDRLLMNSRLVFVFKYIMLVIKSRRIALKGLYDRQAWASSSNVSFKLIENCGGRFHMEGLDNIRKNEGPVVFVSNHMSTLETMVFPGIIAPMREVTFVVKDTLVKHPLFGPVMRARNPILVSRKNLREDFEAVMKKGQEFLSNGISIVIFPQSTRKVEFVPEEFNTLGVKLAAKSGVPVVPVAIKTDFWGNGNLVKDLGPIDRKKPIYIKFGTPISINGPVKDIHNQIIDFIRENLKKWNEM
jgi:1-acyl-sn-glycerol-3-phosphate acyltransferase